MFGFQQFALGNTKWLHVGVFSTANNKLRLQHTQYILISKHIAIKALKAIMTENKNQRGRNSSTFFFVHHKHKRTYNLKIKMRFLINLIQYTSCKGWSGVMFVIKLSQKLSRKTSTSLCQLPPLPIIPASCNIYCLPRT